jgi:Holliday junction DNA helicase RuvB
MATAESDNPIIEESEVSSRKDPPSDELPDADQSVQPDKQQDEDLYGSELRPDSFDDFVGQKRVTENLKVMVESARIRDDVLDHILLSGPPGLGKTTLAHLLSNEMEVDIHVTSGPALEKTGDLAGILNGLSEGDILFIDECHRLDRVIEENLYPAIEDYYIDVVLGEGPTARTMAMPVEKFTLIGATTRSGLVTAPLRSRFGALKRLSLYEPDELKQIVLRTAGILNLNITEDGAIEIAERSRGTPRIANRLLRQVRDYFTVEDADTIDRDFADYALERIGVDEAGLAPRERRYLRTLCEKFGGGPTGLKTMMSALSQEKDNIEVYIEPFLIQRGFIERTPQGRVATRRSYDHLDIPFPADHPARDQEDLL